MSALLRWSVTHGVAAASSAFGWSAMLIIVIVTTIVTVVVILLALFIFVLTLFVHTSRRLVFAWALGTL